MVGWRCGDGEFFLASVPHRRERTTLGYLTARHAERAHVGAFDGFSGFVDPGLRSLRSLRPGLTDYGPLGLRPG